MLIFVALNLLVGVAIFALVLGLSYLLSLFLLRIRLLPPSPYGESPRAQHHGRAKQIAGIQGIYGIVAVLAAYLMTAVAFPMIFFTPLAGPFIFLIAFPIQSMLDGTELPGELGAALLIAIPSLPIHMAAQFCAYGYAVRHVNWLAAPSSSP